MRWPTAPIYTAKAEDVIRQSMRSFIDAYDAYDAQMPSMLGPIRGGAEDYLALMAKKEQALAGYIAYVALCDPNSPALARDHMHAVLGPWIDRAIWVERREDGTYWLTGRYRK